MAGAYFSTVMTHRRVATLGRATYEMRVKEKGSKNHGAFFFRYTE